jgi:hypothetical protein
VYVNRLCVLRTNLVKRNEIVIDLKQFICIRISKYLFELNEDKLENPIAVYSNVLSVFASI